MIRAFVIVCLIAGALCLSDERLSPAVGKDDIVETCPIGFRYTRCGARCQPTCYDRNPTGCLLDICVPGCVCKEGLYLNHLYQCVDEVGCLMRD